MWSSWCMDVMRAFLLLSPYKAGTALTASATMRCSISSRVVISSTAAHPGEHPVPSAGQGILQSPRGGCFSSCLSSHIILKGLRDSGNTGGASLKISSKAWKCVREERPCSEKSSSLNLVWYCQKLSYVITTLPRLGKVYFPGTPWGDSIWPARDSQG